MRWVSLRQPSPLQVEGSLGVYPLRREDPLLSRRGLGPADPDLLYSVEPPVVGSCLHPTGAADAEVAGVVLRLRIPLPRPARDMGQCPWFLTPLGVEDGAGSLMPAHPVPRKGAVVVGGAKTCCRYGLATAVRFAMLAINSCCA